MTRYRKKPVVIEAFQMTYGSRRDKAFRVKSTRASLTSSSRLTNSWRRLMAERIWIMIVRFLPGKARLLVRRKGACRCLGALSADHVRLMMEHR